MSQTNSRTGSPIPGSSNNGSQGAILAPASPILPIPAMGPILPPLPLQPPAPAPQSDTEKLQEIVDGTKNLSLTEFQNLIGQLAGWKSVSTQFERVEKDTVNAIYHYMGREENSLALPWTAAINNINPFRQASTMIESLTQKFRHQCPHFNFETMTGSLSQTPILQYKKSNLTDSGGLLLVSNQQAPTLSQYTETNLKTFVSKLKTQFASGIICNIPIMIPVGPARNTLRNQLMLKTLIKTELEFDHIMLDPLLFLSLMDKFLKRLNLPTGLPSDLEMIRAKLAFEFNTVLDEAQVNKVVEQISIYDYECNDVFLNLLEIDQREYIKVFIEINSQKHLSKCQRKLFSLVKAEMAKFNSMSEACGNVIEQLASASEICHNAWAFGMSYSVTLSR